MEEAELFAPMELPTWFACLLVSCLYILPNLGVFTLEFGQAVLSVFSLPFLVSYFYSVLTNKTLSYRRDMAILLGLSLVSYLLMHPRDPLGQVFDYFLYLLTGFSIYAIYFCYYYFSKNCLKTSTIRSRFFSVFVPTMLTVFIFGVGFRIISHVFLR